EGSVPRLDATAENVISDPRSESEISAIRYDPSANSPIIFQGSDMETLGPTGGGLTADAVAAAETGFAIKGTDGNDSLYLKAVDGKLELSWTGEAGSYTSDLDPTLPGVQALTIGPSANISV